MVCTMFLFLVEISQVAEKKLKSPRYQISKGKNPCKAYFICCIECTGHKLSEFGIRKATFSTKTHTFHSILFQISVMIE